MNLEDNSCILSFDILSLSILSWQMAILHILAILKSKLWISLNPHVPLVVGMYNQKFFTLEIFPYATKFDAWIGGIDCYGVIAKMLEMV